MIIVGLTGSIGHGKTSFAECLAAYAPRHQDWESSGLICEVANGLRNVKQSSPAATDIQAINSWLAALPEILLATVHVDPRFETIALSEERVAQHPEYFVKLFDYLNSMQAQPELLNLEITVNNKSQFRSLLQWLGGYLVTTVNNGIWYDEIVRRIRVAQSSGTQLATVGGVRYPADAERLRNAGGSIIAIRRPGFAEQETADITERDRQLIVPDAVVSNSGSLKQLATCAKQLYSDLQLRQLQKLYETTNF